MAQSPLDFGLFHGHPKQKSPPNCKTMPNFEAFCHVFQEIWLVAAAAQLMRVKSGVLNPLATMPSNLHKQLPDSAGILGALKASTSILRLFIEGFHPLSPCLHACLAGTWTGGVI